jgi:hypothetical protein
MARIALRAHRRTTRKKRAELRQQRSARLTKQEISCQSGKARRAPAHASTFKNIWKRKKEEKRS